MAKLFAATIATASAFNATNTPQCSVNGAAGGQVVTVNDGKYQRCFSLITPPGVQGPMPLLFWFHGSGGNAGHCGNQAELVRLSKQHGFAYICGEATQGVFGNGGQWDLPKKITDQSGTPCGASDSVEPGYMHAVLDHLGKSPQTYDVKRIFTSGCSMGSAFSGYMGNCLKKWNPQQISAFATHSTGLKVKGDGNRLPENWGECAGCQYWPFAPVKYTDSLGLKGCIFDNTGDGDFYKTSKYLATKWKQLGNPTESHFASGGHCQNIPFESIVKCLGLEGGSPSPSPAPTPSPTPTPSPSPSPIPGGEPSADCEQCWQTQCSASKQTDCAQCMKDSKDACVARCKPSLFGQKMMDWWCNKQEAVAV